MLSILVILFQIRTWWDIWWLGIRVYVDLYVYAHSGGFLRQ